MINFLIVIAPLAALPSFDLCSGIIIMMITEVSVLNYIFDVHTYYAGVASTEGVAYKPDTRQ